MWFSKNLPLWKNVCLLSGEVCSNNYRKIRSACHETHYQCCPFQENFLLSFTMDGPHKELLRDSPQVTGRSMPFSNSQPPFFCPGISWLCYPLFICKRDFIKKIPRWKFILKFALYITDDRRIAAMSSNQQRRVFLPNQSSSWCHLLPWGGITLPNLS